MDSSPWLPAWIIGIEGGHVGVVKSFKSSTKHFLKFLFSNYKNRQTTLLTETSLIELREIHGVQNKINDYQIVLNHFLHAWKLYCLLIYLLFLYMLQIYVYIAITSISLSKKKNYFLWKSKYKVCVLMVKMYVLT